MKRTRTEHTDALAMAHLNDRDRAARRLVVRVEYLIANTSSLAEMKTGLADVLAEHATLCDSAAQAYTVGVQAMSALRFAGEETE